MVEPDPWKIIETNQQNPTDTSIDCASNPLDSISNAFEDNFQPEQSGHLADSQEYLQALERKLAKLKNDPNILNQLKARREQCMEHLLQGNIDLGPNSVEEDEDIEANRIQRYIQPEQPINCAELVRIIEHDHLDSVDNNDKDDDNETSQSTSSASRSDDNNKN